MRARDVNECVCLFVCVCVCERVWLSINCQNSNRINVDENLRYFNSCVFVCMFVCVCVCVCVCVRVSVRLSVRLSVCLSVCLSVSTLAGEPLDRF